MKNDFELKQGHHFQFKSQAAPSINFDGNVYCTVLEIIPLKKLSYSWQCGDGNEITIDSVVVWTLHEKENGTELQLVHSGFKETSNLTIIAAMDAGWLKNIQKIAERINTLKNGTANT